MDLAVQLNLETGGSGANIRDISLSGVSCITDHAMPVMTQVELTIVLPTGPDGTHPLTCAGAVVRSEPILVNGDVSPRYETAIFFTQMGESDRSELEEFVAWKRAAGAAVPGPGA